MNKFNVLSKKCNATGLSRGGPPLLSSSDFRTRASLEYRVLEKTARRHFDNGCIRHPLPLPHPPSPFFFKLENVERGIFFKEKKKERRKGRKGKNHRSTVRSINARSPIFYPSLPLFLINLFGNHRLTIPSLPIWRSSPSRCLLDEHLINLRFPFVPPSSLPYSIFHRSIFQRGGGDLPFSIDPG